MSVYSIKDLENFTQIKAHTIRMWEQRYKLLNPSRTDTNIRYYTENDLKKILNINLLYNNGLKISKIAQLSDGEIQKMAQKSLLSDEGDLSDSLELIIQHLVSFDEAAITSFFTEYLSKFNLDYVFSKVIIPLLKKVGELWQVDTITVAHEHFLSNIVRKLLIVNTAEVVDLKKKKGTVLLFLKEDEFHELGLLFYNYYLRTKGYKTVYIGAATPLNDVPFLAKTVEPDFVVTSLVGQIDKKSFIQFMQVLRTNFKLETVFIGGYQTDIYQTEIPEGINVVKTVESLDL